MARKPVTTSYQEHERTFAGFLAVTKWSVVGIVVVLAALYFIVQP